MKLLLSVSLMLFVLVFFTSFSPTTRKSSWKLVWSDEFNYSGLPDSTKWNYEVGGNGWGNNELEYYTSKRKENARVEDGNLVIELRKEKWENKEYTSARLVTKGRKDWKFGKIEVRAKLPKGLGTWPAIWMLGSTTPLKWPDDGEIDIMEHVGFDPGVIHASAHCKKYNHIIHTQKTAVTTVIDCMENFHVYGLEWDSVSMAISVDGKEYFRFTNEHTGYDAWPFSQPMYLLLNVAFGGNWGGAKGIDESILTQKMLVDYVRLYQKD
jgi:beta-glucanase (GH16 family)